MTDYLSMLAPEELLLLRLCRLEFNDNQIDEVRSLVKKTKDWERFVTLANDHGIIALCRYNLVNLGFSDILPGDILKKLTESYLASVARNTKIFRLLDEVLLIAQNAGIEVVLLKGLALELTVYGYQGVRQMNDLDILVAREDAILLRNLLLKNGFVSKPMISPLHEKILPSCGKHLPEMHKNGFSLEIHFKLFAEKGSRLTEEFYNTSGNIQKKHPATDNNKINIYSSSVRIPDLSMHFLYLIKHMNDHESRGNSQIRLYADLMMMISQPDRNIPSKQLVDISSRMHLSEALNHKLFFLDKFFDANIGSHFSSINISVEGIKKEEEFILFLRHPGNQSVTKKNENFFQPMKEFTKFYERIYYITGYLFPSISFMKYRYQAITGFHAFFYYPVRWFKLFDILAGRNSENNR